MYVDASAIIAILSEEPEAPALAKRMDEAMTPMSITPLTLYEAAIGLAGKIARTKGVAFNANLISQADAQVLAFAAKIEAQEVAITPEIGRAAIEVAKRYGKNSGHPARLNFGECFVYAAAKSLGVPLLYKGEDFAQTDIG